MRGLEHGWHSTKMDKCIETIESRLQDGSENDSRKFLAVSDWMTCLDILLAVDVRLLSVRGACESMNTDKLLALRI